MEVLSTKIISKDDMNAARNLGFEVEMLSFISTMPIAGDNLRARLALLQHQQLVVVFTSEQSIACTAAMLPVAPETWRVVCTSGSTRTAAGKWLRPSSILFSGINATEIGAYLSGMPAQEVLFICGDKRLDIVPEALQKAGHVFEELVVYHTELTPAALTRSYDAYLFYSPSGVESFLLSNTIPAESISVAIGGSTAAALKENKINNILTAPSPCVTAMLQTLKSYETSK